jgi:NitT/TauT family transport system permease protein
MSMTFGHSQPPPDKKLGEKPASGFLQNTERLRFAAEGAVSIIVVLSFWEGCVRFFDVQPYIFPAPSAVLLSLWHGIVSGIYIAALAVTVLEIIVGALIGATAGFLLAIIMGSSRLLNRLLYPWVVGIQTIPKVAIAPLMLVWFGFGIESKILIVSLTSMFPVMINTLSGLRSTDPDQVALVKALCGNKMKILRFVQFPAALPYIFAGLNTAIVLAVIAAIVAEFVGARAGIGYLILQANFALDLAKVFSLLVVLGMLGVTLSLFMRAVENRVCFWNRRN